MRAVFNRFERRTGAALACGSLALSLFSSTASGDGGAIDFNRDIRPILSNNCFQCHGPDEQQRQSGLRLDRRESALKPADSGEPAIVPGHPDDSPLIARIFSDDPDLRMPPADSNKSLTAEDKALLRQWIAAGAEMTQHWAFVAPERPRLPDVKQTQWIRNEIDRFTLANLEARGWAPADEASRETLIRRLTFDLTGLPPTLAQIDAFAADTRPDAYLRLVDRLLESPYYGERMALDWLDAARFADTNGYHLDNGRDMSAWRAWVIDAYNTDKPFDEFTIEQLAGDLLPEATLDQKIASGFHRNHMINFEGGAIPEEYHTAYVVDRVNTTGAVWLGLTVGCAQCHDHKFDPLTQREFYQFYAFFNNVPENGLDGNNGNAMPLLKVPTREQAAQLDALEDQIAALDSRRLDDWETVDAEQAAWEHSLRSDTAEPTAPQPVITLGEWSSLGPMVHPEGAARGYKLNLGPERKPVDLKQGAFLAEKSYAWEQQPARLDGQVHLLPGEYAVTYLHRTISATKPAKATISLGTTDAVKLWLNQKELVASDVVRDVAAGQHLVEVELRPGANELLLKVVNFRSEGHWFFALRCEEAVSVPDPVRSIITMPPSSRSKVQQAALRSYYRHCVSENAELKTLATELAALRNQLRDLQASVRTTMVMQEMETPRETFVLLRGQYDRRGEPVKAATPAFLPPLPDGSDSNRLGLARWLVSPANPLVSRVTVNRVWQKFFGVGLVQTAQDFGSQGELPSHPELLDWLAVEFMKPSDPDAVAWSMKSLVRKIVCSATYRQSSRVAPENYARDPENRWLARGARFRLPAEFIRDQALCVSGLIRHNIGGHSVSPYQPAGLWTELSSRGDSSKWTAQVFEQSHGDDLYRRSMYTFWKRTSPPPTMLTFDAPDRETCTVRRSRTNTPLQALILMNDPTYVEASRALAERLLIERGSDDLRFEELFRLLTGRRPSSAETASLARLLQAQRKYFSEHPEAATQLLGVGESPRNEQLAPAEHAAWSMLASAVLNLDETITRN